MRVTKVIIAEGNDSVILVDDSAHLEGVMSFTIHQDAGQQPRLILQLEMTNVDIEQLV